jgi:hypothetical protein
MVFHVLIQLYFYDWLTVHLFPPKATTCPLWNSWSPLPTSEVGTPMRRSYVVPMRWMVIYEYEVSGGALNLFY